MPKRPGFIVNWRDIESTVEWGWPGAEERFGYPAFFSHVTGLSRLKIAQLRLPPGRRANLPTAFRDEEEFYFVVEGSPDLWADGHLYALREGDGVAVNDNTGMAHTIINNSDKEVRIFLMGEGARTGTRYFHPLDPAANARLKKSGNLWASPPSRKRGTHNAQPGNIAGRKRTRPGYVVHWGDIVQKAAARYPKSTEDQTHPARFGRRARFSRIGIHLDLLKPGRRTSYPHAERDEEEFVYVVSGDVDCWIDGHIHKMTEGDFVGFEAKTGITHTIINNGNGDAILLVGAEAARSRNQFWYPYQASQNKAVGDLYWADHPVPKLGPHDGLPDALREKLPKAARRSAHAANEAARWLGAAKKKKK